ncbi:MotA/TolQ/ExbB proton channel family protein [Oecophyllibacter saccharovorans]|uniref:MotA/TolQ/ExbB proton channel family protein n=1 Tax=Oecophyllibacter saccharovorans TaxID=2558360 RepID=UPI001141FE92|nr:MotA/TolQ/ExbB proton channel family protein [Oecophyllibacter saccharovorans]
MTSLFRSFPLSACKPQGLETTRSLRFGRGAALALAFAPLVGTSLAGVAAAQTPAPQAAASQPVIPGASATAGASGNAAEPMPVVPTAPAGPPGEAAAPGATPAGAAPTTGTEATPLAPDTDSKAQASAKSGDNPYGLKALWKNGDIIARSVLLIMAIMSLGSWIIIIVKLLEENRLFKAAREAARSFWGAATVQEGAKTLKPNSPFRYIAETGIIAAEHHEGAMRDSIDLPTWTSLSIQRAVDTINTRLQSGLAFLGTVGSTSPFIGLFGTVWGIYHALTAIGIAGQASIDKVAGPVGESLIMTAIGLATAVPAVLGYNLLVRRNKAAMDCVRNFASDIQSVLLGGYRHADVLSAAKQGTSSNNEPPVTITTSSRV